MGTAVTPSCKIKQSARLDLWLYGSFYCIIREFLFGVGHQHSGGDNVSVYLNDEYVCSSYPLYGQTVGKAGDEKGHLIEMTRCLEANGTSTASCRHIISHEKACPQVSWLDCCSSCTTILTPHLNRYRIVPRQAGGFVSQYIAAGQKRGHDSCRRLVQNRAGGSKDFPDAGWSTPWGYELFCESIFRTLETVLLGHLST